MAPKFVDKRLKKEEIIKSAIRAFLKKGAHGTTISDISEEAGIGKGTIYEYFKSKEEIIFSTYEYFMRQFDADARQVMESAAGPEEKLEKVLMFFSNYIEGEGEEIMELLLDFWAIAIRESRTRGKLLASMKEFYQGFRDMMSNILVEGMANGTFKKNINPDKIATIINGAFDGILIQWILDRESVGYRETLMQIPDMIFNGIRLRDKE